MRSEFLFPLLLSGCLFSGDAEPVTNAGVVAHLLEDRLMDGAVVLVDPEEATAEDPLTTSSITLDGTGLDAGGQGVAWLTQWAFDGSARYTVGRFDAGAVERLTIEGLDPLGLFGLRVGSVGEAVVAFACTAPPMQVFVGMAGDGVLRPSPSPLASCALGMGESADGDLLAVEDTGDGFAVHRYTVGADGLTEVGSTTLPKGSSDRVYRVWDDGAGAAVLAGNGTDLVQIDAQGTLQAPVTGFPLILVRDGAAWLMALNTPETLSLWTPQTGALEPVGQVALGSRVWGQEGLDGVLALESEPWEALDSGAIVTDALWLTPNADGYVGQEMPVTPCVDAATCLEIGEWTPVGVIDAASGRWGLWTVWSWLGPSAAVTAPF